MGVYIPNEDMPKDCYTCFCYETEFNMCSLTGKRLDDIRIRLDDCPLIEIPIPHGRLIDANKLEAMMYHEAFEIDSDMQKWDSGCWIRYKVFENCMNRLLPDTIIGPEE